MKQDDVEDDHDADNDDDVRDNDDEYENEMGMLGIPMPDLKNGIQSQTLPPGRSPALKGVGRPVGKFIVLRTNTLEEKGQRNFRRACN